MNVLQFVQTAVHDANSILTNRYCICVCFPYNSPINPSNHASCLALKPVSFQCTQSRVFCVPRLKCVDVQSVIVVLFTVSCASYLPVCLVTVEF